MSNAIKKEKMIYWFASKCQGETNEMKKKIFFQTSFVLDVISSGQIKQWQFTNDKIVI